MLILSASSILPCIAEIIHLFSLSYQLCICIFWIFAMLPFKLLDHICHGFLYFCKLYYNIGWYNKENYIILWCKIPAANSLAQKKQRVLSPPKSRSNEDYPSCWVDGAWDASSHCGGFGWIIKVPDNTTVFKDSRQIVCGLSPHRWSNRSKASSQSGGSHGAFKSQPIFGFLCDIWNLVSLFNHLSFFHVSRTSNVLVDSSKISSSKSWFQTLLYLGFCSLLMRSHFLIDKKKDLISLLILYL